MSSREENSFDPRRFLASAPAQPGIYDMRDADGETLYVGKAKNLKKRLASYFRNQGLSVKTKALVEKIASVELTVTHSELEALLLEQNLIKTKRPPYNILLRDDKSYPFIYLSIEDDYPRLEYSRNRRKGRGGIYYGPYPSSQAVRSSLNLLQKIFKVRQCDNQFFSNRTRPCLQYQIKRCKAPCVGLVDREEYRQDVGDTQCFLTGKNRRLINRLEERMESASNRLRFEEAAELRDQIQQLRIIQEGQAVSSASGDADVIGHAEKDGTCCFVLLPVRHGLVLGTQNFFPKFALDSQPAQRVAEFLGHFYVQNADLRNFPSEVIVPRTIEGMGLLEQAIRSVSDRAVSLKKMVRGQRREWQLLANRNAELALNSRLASRVSQNSRNRELAALLGLTEPLHRIECFDISHTMGEATVASCVVFNVDGPDRQFYRRYNIREVTAGDDFAAMRQALHRRYRSEGESDAPDLVIVDGGKGQLKQAQEVMGELSLSHIHLLGIAKGTTRKPGLETLYFQGRVLNSDLSQGALALLQHIRDEAHRFAITHHRKRRDRSRTQSSLEAIPGVGAKRRQALLKYFGSRENVASAPLSELAKVSGISQSMAQSIYDSLRSG